MPYVIRTVAVSEATLSPESFKPRSAGREKVAIYDVETNTRQIAMGSFALLGGSHDLSGDVFSNGGIVPLQRQFPANILKRRRHVGERRLIEIQN
jgi:hypothetical protein